MIIFIFNLKLAVIRVLSSIRHLSLGSELIRGEDVLESGVHGPVHAQALGVRQSCGQLVGQGVEGLHDGVSVDVALGADPANLLEHAGLHAPDLVEETLNDPKIDDTLVLVFLASFLILPPPHGGHLGVGGGGALGVGGLHLRANVGVNGADGGHHVGFQAHALCFKIHQHMLNFLKTNPVFQSIISC